MDTAPIERISRPASLPDRPAQGHKGTFGRVLIIGGHEEMIGAPVLAGMAALRLGAGLVQIVVPRSILPAALTICPELIGLGLSGDVKLDIPRIAEAAEAADAIVIGPGLGKSDSARGMLKTVVGLYKPIVIDADGLNLLAALKRWPGATFHAKAVLTPHPMEMRRLSMLLPPADVGGWASGGKIPGDEAARESIAMLAARTFGQTIILKGHQSVVTDGIKLYVNHTGDSTLAKAGSGDILSGMIGCLLAQGLEPFAAATLGAHLHGRAGELAGAKFGQRSALGREVIGEIGEAIKGV